MRVNQNLGPTIELGGALDGLPVDLSGNETEKMAKDAADLFEEGIEGNDHLERLNTENQKNLNDELKQDMANPEKADVRAVNQRQESVLKEIIEKVEGKLKQGHEAGQENDNARVLQNRGNS